MKFSVVIPVHNVEQYLRFCIDSVMKQSYQNFEIVLVDDGSTDSSGLICDQYAQQCPDKVLAIHNLNQGQLMTRSCGIDHSTGDVLLFVDSDDALRSDALELLRGRFRDSDCDMVLFNASTEENFGTRFQSFSFSDGQFFLEDSKRELYEMIVTTRKLNPLWLKAVKRHVSMAVPEEYRFFGLRNAGDLLYAMPMLTAAKSISYMEQNLYYYRLRRGSIVHTYNPVRHKSIKKVHQEMEKYIDLWGMQELHPQHYAREVRGWVECLKQLLRNAAGDDADNLLKELASDEYFRNAYQKMAADKLTKRDMLLARWLYEEKYGRLRMVGGVLRQVRKLQQFKKNA